MNENALCTSADLVAQVLYLWRQKNDTTTIAARVGLPEATIYNMLARLFDGDGE